MLETLLMSAALAAERPNIVFFLSDDHACAATGAYGSVINDTPSIDRIARDGMTFDAAFCDNAICAPSRATFLTGTYAHHHGVDDNGDRFDGSQPTFPKLLQDAGYRTALFGKWHLKSDPTGFDTWDILPGQGHYYAPDFRNPRGKRRIPGHVSEITTDLAIEWLDQHTSDTEPFMVMINHKAPHRAWMPAPEHHGLFEGETVPEPPTLLDDHAGRTSASHDQEMSIGEHMWLWYDLKIDPMTDAELTGPDRWAHGRYDRMSPEQLQAWQRAYGPRNDAWNAAALAGDELTRAKYQRYIKDYLRCVAGVDDSVGRVLDWLEDSGHARDTIVIYASDQGFFLGEQGWYDKRFMNEPALRLPLIVRWPGVTAPGTRNDDLVQNIDLAPTVLAAGGVDAPDDMHGRDLRPLLVGSTPADWREGIYYRYMEQGIHNVPPHEGVRTDRWKIIHWPTLDEWELFDLATDPNEVSSLHDSPDHAEILDLLKTRLELARTHAGAAPMPTPTS